jgi:hypothetical protein
MSMTAANQLGELIVRRRAVLGTHGTDMRPVPAGETVEEVIMICIFLRGPVRPRSAHSATVIASTA